jgi:hypothetical protein
MPSLQIKSAESGIKPFLSSQYLETSRMGVIDTAKFTTDTQGNLSIIAGTMLALAADGKLQGVKRANLRAAALAAAVTLDVTEKMVPLFVVGDVLTTMPHARVNLTGVWAEDDTLSITLGNATKVITAADGVLANIAALTAAELNADSDFSPWIKAIASGDNLHIFSLRSGISGRLDIAVADTATGAAAIEGSKTFLSPTAIGTISAVDLVNSRLTVASSSAPELPVGSYIKAPHGEIWGMVSADGMYPDHSTHLGLITKASLIRDRMPYLDADCLDLGLMVAA